MSQDAHSARSLDRAIAKRWPQPIAAAWQRAMAQTDPSARLDALIFFNEVLLRCLVAMLLADYLSGPAQPGRRNHNHIESLLNKLKRPADGHWQTLVANIPPHLASRDGRGPFMPELGEWLAQVGPGGKTRERELNNLVRLRNNFRHDGAAVSATQVKERLDTFERPLRAILASLSWLSQYRWIRVARASPGSGPAFGGTLHLLMGSSDIPEAISLTWEGWLAEGDVYVVNPAVKQALRLSPWVQVLGSEKNPAERVFLLKKRTRRDLLLLFHDASNEWLEVPCTPPPDTFAEWLDTHRNTDAVTAFETGSPLLASLDVVDTHGLFADRYEIVEPIGEGGMSRVFKARDTRLGVHVALKVLRDEIGDDPILRTRFEREAQVMRKLDHRRILDVHDIATLDDGRMYLTMPLMKASLAQLIKEGDGSGRPGIRGDRFFTLAKQAAGAIAVLHRHQTVHRDIKPTNFLVDDGDELVLADFGIARTADAPHLTATNAQIGSMFYMAPEVSAGETAWPPADVYGLAVVLHEMASGHRPLEGPGQKLDHAVAPLVRDMSQRHPDRRPTIRDVLKRLAALQNEQSKPEPSKPEPSTPDPSKPEPRKRQEKRRQTQIETPEVLAAAWPEKGPQASRESSGAPTPASPVSDAAPSPAPKPAGHSRVLFVLPLIVLLAVAGGGIWMGLQSRGDEDAAKTHAAAGAAAHTGLDEAQYADMVRVEGGLLKPGTTTPRLEADVALCKAEAYHRCNVIEQEKRWSAREVASFLLDRTEVSRGAFDACVSAEVCPDVDTDRCYVDKVVVASKPAEAPQTCVTLEEAAHYCRWRGKRLPSEAEWEWAAKGADERVFPWGDDWDEGKANLRESERAMPRPLVSVDAYGTGDTPEGVRQMAGNAYEWVDPSFDGQKVMRGGSAVSPLVRMRTTTRQIPADPDDRMYNMGFRCAADAKEKP